MLHHNTEFTHFQNYSMLKFQYKSDLLKIVIEEDFVGFYLTVYENPNSLNSNKDYLFDSLEDAFNEAEEKFSVRRDEWKIVS